MSRYLSSRKNAFGLGGALLGPVLHLAGVLDGVTWPFVSVALYAAVALVVPPEPAPEVGTDPLPDVLRHDLAGLRADVRRGLPPGAPGAARRILDVLAGVLDALDRPADRTEDRIALPQRLARVDTLVRHDLPEALAAHRAGGSPAALAEHLALIAAAADALAAEVPDTRGERAEDLTRDLRRRYPPAPGE